MSDKYDDSYLKRLPREYYRDQAYVHWSLTICDRKQGWLKPIMLYRFRELLTHTMFRHGLCCPIFVLMPDHLHMMWLSVLDGADQLPAMKHFRSRMNEALSVFDCQLQDQPYENVLKEDQRLEHAFAEVCEYIARNPERAGLVADDGYSEYKYSGCIIPGYPELKPFTADYWTRFWRAYSYLQKNGFIRLTET